MRARIATLLLVALAQAGAASAQTPGFTMTTGVESPRTELGAAVSMNGFTDINTKPTCAELALPCLSGKEFPDFGWALSGARSISDWLALTGEIAVANNTWYSRPDATAPDVNHVYSFMLGPRLATTFLHSDAGNPIDFRVFAQILLGAQVSNVAEGGNAKRPGVGIDVHTRAGIMIRTQFDYSFVQQRERRSISGSRWSIGLVLGID